MPQKGDELVNPVSGERVVFLETRASSNNEVLRMEAFGLIKGFNETRHIHPNQHETHTVLGGVMGVEMDGREYTLRANDSITFPPNVPHKFWNISGDDLHFITEFRPAYETEDFIETYIANAQTGNVNEKGQPRFLHFFVILHHYPIAGYLAGVPVFLQKIVIALLAFIGRLFGYKGSMKSASNS
jgi:mannose-6-phosphate isomerase-like protein (cupin superfamily)